MSFKGLVFLCGFAALFGLGLSFNYHLNSDTSSPPSHVSIAADSVKGNIIEDLSAKDEYVSINKTVKKYKTNNRVVYFNDQFSFYTVRQAVIELKELEAQSNEPIFLLIDSPGGSVFDGATLIAQMEASKAPVYTVCTRLCASMAAITHSYGHKRMMLDKAQLMFHPASGSISGQVPNMLSMLKSITRYIDKTNANIVGRSKLTRAEYESLIAYEIWIDSEDSVAKGLAEEIVSLDVNNTPTASDLPLQSEFHTTTTEAKKFNLQIISPYAKELW